MSERTNKGKRCEMSLSFLYVAVVLSGREKGNGKSVVTSVGAA